MSRLAVKLRVWVRSRLADRRPAAVALAALFAGAALCLTLGILFPLSSRAPIGLGVILDCLAVAFAAGTLALGGRLPDRVLLGEVALAIVLNHYLVLHSHTRAGVMADSLAYGWLTLYVAVFFPAWTLACAGLAAAGFGAALLVTGLPNVIVIWALVSITMTIAGLVVAHMSRAARRQIATDSLTGALNRVGLEVAGERLLGALQRRMQELTMAVIDLDGFKLVNDREGHAMGDRMLVEAARAWRAALRGTDVLARLGGDEFVLLMPGTSIGEAHTILDRLRSAHPVRWSVGVASWSPGEPLEQCLVRADKQLCAVKLGRQMLAPATS